jgi:uncharacterized membrane protein
MELVETIEQTLAVCIAALELLLEALGAVCIAIGLVKTAQIVIAVRRRHSVQFPYIDLRLRFGTWLALALEFQLGADILTTTIAPTFDELSKLAVIAVIRTFLNYFLNKELEAAYKMQERTHPTLDMMPR